MIEAATIKAKRTAAGIAGNILCKKIGTARSRLSDIERGFITPSPEELARIDRALDEFDRGEIRYRPSSRLDGLAFGSAR